MSATCPYCKAPAGRAYLSSSSRWQHDCIACDKISRARVATENGKTVIISLSRTGPASRLARETYTFIPADGQREWINDHGGARYIRMLIDNDMKYDTII
jgi:hypothetical protein